MWYAFAVFSLTALVFAWMRVRNAWQGESTESEVGQFQHELLSFKGMVYEQRIGIEGVETFDFCVKRETVADRLFVALGVSRELTVGDAEFDKRLFVVSEDWLLRDALVRSRQLRADLIALAEACKELGVDLRQLCAQSGRLWLRLKPLARWIDGDEQHDVVALARELVPLLHRVRDHLAHLRPERFEAVRDRHARSARIVRMVSLAIGAVGATGAALSVVADDRLIVDQLQLALLAAAMAIAIVISLGVLAITALGGTSRAHLTLVDVAWTGSIGGFVAAVFLLRAVNIEQDRSEPAYLELPVRGTEVASSRRSTRYHVLVDDWTGRQDPHYRFLVSQPTMLASVPQRSWVGLHYRHGALGIRWIESYEVFHATPEFEPTHAAPAARAAEQPIGAQP